MNSTSEPCRPDNQRCMDSGLFIPVEYVKKWTRSTGIDHGSWGLWGLRLSSEVLLYSTWMIVGVCLRPNYFFNGNQDTVTEHFSTRLIPTTATASYEDKESVVSLPSIPLLSYDSSLVSFIVIVSIIAWCALIYVDRIRREAVRRLSIIRVPLRELKAERKAERIILCCGSTIHLPRANLVPYTVKVPWIQ